MLLPPGAIRLLVSEEFEVNRKPKMNVVVSSPAWKGRWLTSGTVFSLTQKLDMVMGGAFLRQDNMLFVT